MHLIHLGFDLIHLVNLIHMGSQTSHVSFISFTCKLHISQFSYIPGHVPELSSCSFLGTGGKDEGKPCIARRNFIRPFAGGAAEAGRSRRGEDSYVPLVLRGRGEFDSTMFNSSYAPSRDLS